MERLKEASDSDGLGSPKTMAIDMVVSFKVALWFWMENVHSVITSDHATSLYKRPMTPNKKSMVDVQISAAMTSEIPRMSS
uniref:Uncharacterized protein n=1 Tax=Nelumbo nucifera TaxID=4432 RepID=A0A822Z7N3_NELNU|nr:TPA_asm: hypothetical protein HUJ06_014014 [Nelumbo nucifera]